MARFCSGALLKSTTQSLFNKRVIGERAVRVQILQPKTIRVRTHSQTSIPQHNRHALFDAFGEATGQTPVVVKSEHEVKYEQLQASAQSACSRTVSNQH